MAPSSCIDLNPRERRKLLETARLSIDMGLAGCGSLQVDTAGLSAPLRSRLGVFVTLSQAGKLRGCIGLLESSDPLAQAVADSAYGAAFRDRRFAKLTEREFRDTCIEISTLSVPERLMAASKADALASLESHVDGLSLEDGKHRATFLPKVWEKMPDAQSFLEQLLVKAGLPSDHWSETIKLYRYRALCFSEPPPAGSEY